MMFLDMLGEGGKGRANIWCEFARNLVPALFLKKEICVLFREFESQEVFEWGLRGFKGGGKARWRFKDV